MSMRKTLALLACLLALATLFVSCTAEQTGDLATVKGQGPSVQMEMTKSMK